MTRQLGPSFLSLWALEAAAGRPGRPGAGLQPTCQRRPLRYFLASEIKGVVDPCLQLAEQKGVGNLCFEGAKRMSVFLSDPGRK